MMELLNTGTTCSRRIKFLYSYGGRIVPRPCDGLLRYVGGYTRVLAVDRSVTFSELMVKFGESCGSSMDLRCKLPSGELDLLISVKSDGDLRNVFEEYDRVSSEMKIRALLFPIKSAKKISAPSSPMSNFDFPSAVNHERIAPASALCHGKPRHSSAHQFCIPAIGYPAPVLKHRGHGGRNSNHVHHVPHRNYSPPHYN